MELRKLQSTGGASLTLTLPKQWVNKWKLKGKDEVFVTQNGHTLIVTPVTKNRDETTFNINVDEVTESWLVRESIAAYIAGADKINFRSNKMSPAQNQIIRKAVQLLFGFEILEETSQKIYVKNIFDDYKLSVPQSTHKIFLITKSMFEDSLKAIQNGDKNLASDIELRDNEVNKLLYVIKRQFYSLLSGKSDGNLAELSYYQGVAVQLERIADHAVKIASLAHLDGSKRLSLSSNFSTIEATVHRLLNEVEEVVNSLDKIHAHKILDTNTVLERLIYGSKQMKKSYEGALIEDSLDRLRGYLMNIAELTIDYSFAKT